MAQACVPVCPVSAIIALDDLPEKWAHFTQRNADYYGRKFTLARRSQHDVTQPPIEYIGRGGGTKRCELISWPIHLPETHERIAAAIPSSDAPPRNSDLTSVSLLRAPTPRVGRAKRDW
jgi:hypothetical protein